MNIALFASAFYPHFGGVEECCRNLALEYGRRGHRVSLITSRHPHTLPARETAQGVDVWRFPFELPNSSAAGLARFARRFPRDLAAVVRLVRKQKADLIHVQCVGPNGFYAYWTARLTGLPLVVTTQGERTMDAGNLYGKSATANWTLRALLKRADYVTACSQQTLDDAKQFAGFPLDHRSRPVYNGIALDEFDAHAPPFPHPRPYLFAIGRLVPQKGFDVLLDAYARIAGRPNAPDLLIAGDGAERENLQKRTQQLGLTDCVHLLGLLVPGENPPALAAAMQSLLDCPERAAALGQAGRARVAAEFTWPHLADQYFEGYESVSGS